jgi:hypothetical protein
MVRLVERIVGAAVAFLVLVIGGAVACGLAQSSDCEKSVAADEAAVHTDHHLTAVDLPGVGDYPQVHWMDHAGSDPCRGIGPTEWTYQDVIVMQPADARALLDRSDWFVFSSTPPGSSTPSPPAGQVSPYPSGTVDPSPMLHSGRFQPSQVWPPLAPFLPADPHWLYSLAYDNVGKQSQNRSVYLDVDHSTMLVFTWDS